MWKVKTLQEERTWCSWHFMVDDLLQEVAKDQHSLISVTMLCYVSCHRQRVCNVLWNIFLDVFRIQFSKGCTGETGVFVFSWRLALQLTNGECAPSLPAFRIFICNEKVNRQPSLIMAENLKWAWMTLPETHHSITKGYMSPGVVYCRSRTL